MQTELSERAVKVATQFKLPQEFLLLMQEWDTEQLRAVLQVLTQRREQVQVLLCTECDTQKIFRLQGEISALRKLIDEFKVWFDKLQEENK